MKRQQRTCSIVMLPRFSNSRTSAQLPSRTTSRRPVSLGHWRRGMPDGRPIKNTRARASSKCCSSPQRYRVQSSRTYTTPLCYMNNQKLNVRSKQVQKSERQGVLCYQPTHILSTLASENDIKLSLSRFQSDVNQLQAAQRKQKAGNRLEDLAILAVLLFQPKYRLAHPEK